MDVPLLKQNTKDVLLLNKYLDKYSQFTLSFVLFIKQQFFVLFLKLYFLFNQNCISFLFGSAECVPAAAIYSLLELKTADRDIKVGGQNVYFTYILSSFLHFL